MKKSKLAKLYKREVSSAIYRPARGFRSFTIIYTILIGTIAATLLSVYVVSLLIAKDEPDNLLIPKYCWLIYTAHISTDVLPGKWYVEAEKVLKSKICSLNPSSKPPYFDVRCRGVDDEGYPNEDKCGS